VILPFFVQYLRPFLSVCFLQYVSESSLFPQRRRVTCFIPFLSFQFPSTNGLNLLLFDRPTHPPLLGDSHPPFPALANLQSHSPFPIRGLGWRTAPPVGKAIQHDFLLHPFSDFLPARATNPRLLHDPVSSAITHPNSVYYPVRPPSPPSN